jgi:hypothetical protein
MLGQELGRPPSDLETGRAGAGIRASTVDDDGFGKPLRPSQMVAAQHDRRCLREIGREESCGARSAVSN